ncbi:hypothetical protein PAPYR_3785 [Paratrimastix pyriformis]|uniref:Rab3 GTPase-activating protein catalytic subunit n=1 Tax=Paratrimastix pyriformis TaxID=342808 RepID=A0ABQ8ULI6_9EUKA|nr:hypothetical protein PAPYR_3785 [Paratrimastix pyriformis]
MQAFKAANPYCVLGDFVRWYSPKDWVVVLPLLFGFEKQAEAILDELLNAPPAELFKQLLPVALNTAYNTLRYNSTLAEALPPAHSPLPHLAALMNRCSLDSAADTQRLVGEVAMVEMQAALLASLATKLPLPADPQAATSGPGPEDGARAEGRAPRLVRDLLMKGRARIRTEAERRAVSRLFGDYAAMEEQDALDRFAPLAGIPQPAEESHLLPLVRLPAPRTQEYLLLLNAHRHPTQGPLCTPPAAHLPASAASAPPPSATPEPQPFQQPLAAPAAPAAPSDSLTLLPRQVLEAAPAAPGSTTTSEEARSPAPAPPSGSISSASPSPAPTADGGAAAAATPVPTAATSTPATSGEAAESSAPTPAGPEGPPQKRMGRRKGAKAAGTPAPQQADGTTSVPAEPTLAPPAPASVSSSAASEAPTPAADTAATSPVSSRGSPSTSHAAPPPIRRTVRLVTTATAPQRLAASYSAQCFRLSTAITTAQ